MYCKLCNYELLTEIFYVMKNYKFYIIIKNTTYIIIHNILNKYYNQEQ